MSLVPPSSALDDFGRTPAEVEKARRVASRRLREAINAFFVAPPTLEAFPETDEGLELRALVETHGVALAAHVLSALDGGRSRKVVRDAERAESWLQEVRAGNVDLSPLPSRSASGGRQRQIEVIGGRGPAFPAATFDPSLGARRWE